MRHLAIGPWVSYGRPGHTDVVVVAKRQELFAGELRTVVGDDGVGDPKPVDNVSEEQHRARI